MNELVIPPAPLWYKSSVVVCSPDNTLVYGSKNDIVVIRDKNPVEPAEVRLIHMAHSKSVTSVSLNRKWKEPHSYVVSLGEDNIVKIWDLDTFEKKTSNKDHLEHKEQVIGAVFAGDDRVVSASIHGLVNVWNINTHESKLLKDLFKSKVTLTCLSSCPHAGWLVAFGLNNGGVIIADLRRDGHVLYKLRGHYQAVVSLSWCPAPINVFPRHNQNTVKNKSLESDENDQKNIESLSSGEKKVNPWINLVHADDGEVPPDKNTDLKTTATDFLKECDTLKSKILGLESEPKIEAKEDVTEENESFQLERFEIRQKLDSDRPLPKLFDPSCDFLDDSVCDSSSQNEEIFEDKDLDNEKNNTCQENEAKTESADSEKLEESLELYKDKGDEKNHCVENSSDGVNENIEEDKDFGSEKDHKNEENAITGESSKIENDEGSVAIPGESSKTENEDKVENSPPPEAIEEEPRSEFLLASSGKDKSIYIWRAGTDGRMQTFFHDNRKVNRRDKNASSWISLCWIAPNTLLTSSPNGELLAWSLPRPKESNKQFRIVHFEHSSLIFNIVAAPKYSTSFNWREKADMAVWTCGQDGRLICFDLDAGKIRMCYHAITATVTCFSSSSLDPNRLALGLRDGGIRVWDLSLPHTKVITMQKYQKMYSHKVSTVAWHPEKEMILGFGTEEGRVGFLDVASKKTTLFPLYFRNQVYKVEWGPINGDIKHLGLYVVAEGKMAIYDMEKTNEEPTCFELPEKLYVYKFAWKPDYKLLLLNGKDGSLVILTTNLVAITTLYPNEKGLNGIVWHPDSLSDDTDVFPRCNWFAATTTKGVLVYDCRSIKTCDNFADNIVAIFEGHVKPPLALAWCPFQGDKIVSTAADGLAHVWDVTTKTAVATFVDPYLNYNAAVVWSPIDPDLIILGDRLIKIWSVSKNPPKIDEEFLAEKKRLLTKMSKNEVEKPEKNKIKIDIPAKPKSVSKNCIVPTFYVSNDENIDLQVDQMRKLMCKSQDEENATCLRPLEIFGSKEQVSRLLDDNYNQQKKDGKFKSCELISLWKGNVGEYIQNAINENRVNPSIITLAPMVSPKLWQEACLSYAKKLSETAGSDPFETATYFLACHKIEDAIDALCISFMFKEALALAKQRLPENSDITIKITEKWAEHCINTGNFENAAFCYISIEQYENAAKILARRNHTKFLDFAAELAEKEGNKGLYDSIKFKCNELKNGAGDNNQVDEVPTRIDAILKSIGDTQEEASESGSEIYDDAQSGGTPHKDDQVLENV